MTGLAYLQLDDFAQALSRRSGRRHARPRAGVGPPHLLRRAGPARAPGPGQAGRARGRPARPRGGRRPHRARRARCRPPAIDAGAVAAARHAIELDPHDADAHSTLGEIMFEQDRPDDAIPAYERALALDPEDADALNNLAVARLRAHGRRDRRAVRGRRDGWTRAWTSPATTSSTPARRAAASSTGASRTVALVVALHHSRSPSRRRSSSCCWWRCVFETIRALEVRRLSAPTRQLLADDRRARRLKPRRWDWLWPFRLRPWWWLLFEGLFRDARRARRRRRDPV